MELMIISAPYVVRLFKEKRTRKYLKRGVDAPRFFIPLMNKAKTIHYASAIKSSRFSCHSSHFG